MGIWICFSSGSVHSTHVGQVNVVMIIEPVIIGYMMIESLLVYHCLLNVIWTSSGPGFFGTPACPSFSIFHMGGNLIKDLFSVEPWMVYCFHVLIEL